MSLVYRVAKPTETPNEFVLSDESVDRYGDVISVTGWDLKHFKHNPIALYNHSSNAVIGRWESVRVEGKRLIGRLVLAAAGTSRLVDEVRALWEQRILRAVSVGFRDVEREPLTKDADPYFGPFRYLKQELVECSLVAVPANPNALQVSKALELPAAIAEQIFGKPASDDLRRRAAIPGKSAKPQLLSGVKNMKISKRIEAAQSHLNRLRDQLTTLSDKEDPSDEDNGLLDQLPQEIADQTRELERLVNVERALTVPQADPPEDIIQAAPRSESPRPFAVPKKQFSPRDLIIRGAAINLMAHIKKQSPIDVARAMYGDDEATMWLIRGPVAPAKTTVPGWAQELVTTGVVEFLNLLPRDSIYAPLAAKGTKFTFGRNGQIRIPARTATPQISGAFIGEGDPIPVKRLGLTSVLLTPKKMGVISTFTREMANHSTPAIEGIIRDAMGEDTSVAIDAILLDNQAATTIRPAGLLNGVTPLTATTGGGATAMVTDLKNLIGAITASRGGRNIAILINPAQALAISFLQTTTGDFMFNSTDAAGSRFGVSFIVSPNVPIAQVIALDAADFSSVTGDSPEYDVSDQATIHEDDTAPLPIVGGVVTPPILASVAAPVRSLWQTASYGVRMLLDMNWTMRRAGMVQAITAVTW